MEPPRFLSIRLGDKMKLAIKTGDKVKVTCGKNAGKEAVVEFIDKRSNRVRLEGLKKNKASKKGSGKDLHGTYHVSNLVLIKPEVKEEAPQAEAAAQ